ncbi:GAF domain-containing protein [Hyalangium gracile]|uniref:GAF domain-containing protein n=1 Tax=Hyalangium gracile TaxID=394092 RepID=UPI001CCB1EEB|nr:GAF domain-containing protein [Hyalangium gracile]
MTVQPIVEAVAAALPLSRETFDAIARACPLAIMLLDAQGHVKFWNPAAERIFGWSSEEVLGQFLPAIPVDRREEFVANLQRIFARGDIRGVDTRRQTRNRGLIDVQLWAHLVELPDGRTFCLSLVSDVSQWRQLARQHALQLEIARLLADATTLDAALPECLRTICAGMSCQVGQLWSLSPDSASLRLQAFHSTSPGGADAFTRRSAELSFHLGEGLPGSVWRSRRPVFVPELSIEVMFRRRQAAEQAGLCSGGAFPIEIGGQFIGVMEFFRTSTFTEEEEPREVFEALGRQMGQFAERVRQSAEREQALREAKAAAEEARRQADRLHLLAETSRILSSSLDFARTLDQLVRLLVPTLADMSSVSLVSPEGRLERVAEAARDEQTARTMAEFRAARFPQDADHPLAQTFRTGQGYLFEDYPSTVARRLPPGHPYVDFIQQVGMRSALTVPLLRGERVIGVLALAARDDFGRSYTQEDLTLVTAIAERAAVAIENAQLHQMALEADRRKDEFLAMLSHELRNPLAPIRTALELMRLRAGDVVFRRERQVIERQMDQLQRLVNDLLDVARITRGKIQLDREPLELSTVVTRSIEMVSPLLEEKRHTLRVEVPRVGLRLSGDRHRLAQVFSNLLSNAARYTDSGGNIELVAEREPDGIVVRIRDNGRGIERSLLARVFELFVQGPQTAERQQGGLGIGLALVKNLVELHGGRVEAASAGMGKGSEFTVRLPLQEAAQPPAQPEERPPLEASKYRARLLVVDDNREAAEALTEALGLLGYEARATFDPAEALREAKSFLPEVAICDLGLPVMDGYELGRQLRAQRSGQPLGLIALTGYGQEHDHARSREARFDAHLVKPVDLSTLLATLTRVLEDSRRSPR